MNYVERVNLKNTRRNSRIPTPLTCVGVIIILLVLLYSIFPNFISSTVTSLVRPIWVFQQNLFSDGEIPTPSESVSARNDVLQKENDELKALLGRVRSVDVVLAVVLKKPPFSAYDTLILDYSNTEVGAKVYASIPNIGDVPIGEISEIKSGTSKVRLYSTAGNKFNVLIGSSHIEATAYGKGGGVFEVELPHDSKVKKGDAVTIPDISDNFVGTVDDIVSEPSHPFSKILFSQPTNIYELTWVLVAQSSKKNGK